MENELETLTKLVDKGIEFGVAYGFQILGALDEAGVKLLKASWPEMLTQSAGEV